MAKLAKFDALDVHLAVLAGKENQTPGQPFDAAHPLIYGTAFPIAPGLFLTAAHVHRDASADGRVAVARLTDHGDQIGLVSEVETWEEFDLALMACPFFKSDTAGILAIDFGALTVFDDVSAQGFPFSIDPERLTWVSRGFKGHVVTRRELYHVPGQPPGYELSFFPPPGLSGAPLLNHRHGGAAICGWVIQNYTVETGGVETRLGIAVASEVLLWLDSEIVGGPLGKVWGKEKRKRGAPTPVRNLPPTE